MSWLYRVSHRRKLEEQLEKELRFHLDQYANDLIGRGCAPEEARRQAQPGNTDRTPNNSPPEGRRGRGEG